MLPSPAVEEYVTSWFERLDHRFGGIERCSVVIEQPHRHHRQGRTFEVHVHLAAAARSIAITHSSGHDTAHEDVYVAIADAFRAARRGLEEQLRIRRGEIKLHA